MGFPATSGPHTRFTEFRIPDENVLADGTAATVLVNQAFTATAGLVGAFSVSIMRAAFEAALTFAKEDSRGGSGPIIQHQSVTNLLVDIKMRTDSARLLTWKALHALENGPGNFANRQELCLQAKIFCSDSCVKAVTDAMSAVGMSVFPGSPQLVIAQLTSRLGPHTARRSHSRACSTTQCVCHCSMEGTSGSDVEQWRRSSRQQIMTRGVRSSHSLCRFRRASLAFQVPILSKCDVRDLEQVPSFKMRREVHWLKRHSRQLLTLIGFRLVKADMAVQLSLLSSVCDKSCIEVGCSAAEKPYPSPFAARGCRQCCSSCNCSCTQHSAHSLRVHLTALVDVAISAIRNPLRGSSSRSEVRLKETRDALQTRNVIWDAVRSFVQVVFSSAASASWREVPCRGCVRIA